MVFGRSSHPPNNATTDPTGSPAGLNNPRGARFSEDVAREKGGHQYERMGPYKNGKWRPGFGEWVKLYWLDIVTMALLGAVGLGVYFAKPAPSRSFPVTFSPDGTGEVVFPQFAYPMRNEIVPIWLAALLAFIIPFFFFSIFQIRIRSFEDFNCATFGLLYSLITAAVFQVFIKWLIGGLRPHFLDICRPDTSKMRPNGFNGIMYDRTICTGDPNEIDDSLESMPSGHSTAAWAGFVFLSLYFNGKMKIFADYRPHYIKQVFFFAPLLGACLISGALTIDEFHHWYDVLAGAIIGAANAFAAYRISYASIWDFRFNHIPLPRLPHHNFSLLGRYTPHPHHSNLSGGGRFNYDASGSGFDPSFPIPPFARSGGWGAGGNLGGIGGAPGDALKGGLGGLGGAGGIGGMGQGHGHGHGHGDGFPRGEQAV